MLKRHKYRWPAQDGNELDGWKAVPGTAHYEAHPSGLIRNRVTRHVLAPRPLPSGYLRTTMTLDGLRDTYIHTVVLETFLGPRPSKEYQASHLDGNRANNSITNLCWELPVHNNARKWAHGTRATGTRNGMGKKTHCKRGHEFTEANTRRADGKRICRTCARDHMRARRAQARG